MAINYPVWFLGSVLMLAGFVGLLLTHFGIVSGFLWITPIIWGAAFGVYAVSLGLMVWWADLIVALVATGFFELAIYLDMWGLRSVI